ncbi:Methyl-CpG DNA binding protein [Corchorus capsularis]|uniref:Methyl-CpG DNA binding protein n=1 Tax=Corchorus capsularis TaxID=210143 RepID=A0A1R3ITY7_COCAP|nr:Methyl-CpG DNA binding protein [Corchorus capsularis]
MEDQAADDWLPPGWKVEVRHRRNGKKDKCYYAPCGEIRFLSRAEVCRYLDKCRQKTEDKEKGSAKGSPNNVTVEKVAAEGLPPGWIKETKITKKGNKVRRDAFYNDPASGYVFRSMKDALRYVETGEPGRLAFKPKDKSDNDEDLEEDNDSEPGTVERQKVAVNGITDETERQSAEQVSNLSGITKEEEMLTSASTGEQTSLSKNTPNQLKGGKLSSLNLSEAKGSEEIGGKGSEEGVSGNIVGSPSDKQSHKNGITDDETEKTQPGKGKTKRKKSLNVPRRASKRLAGVALDPTPELKTTRVRRSSITEESEAVPDAVMRSSPGSTTPSASKQPDQLQSTPERSVGIDDFKSKERIAAPNNMLSSRDKLSTRVRRSSIKEESEAVPDAVMRSSPGSTTPSASKQPDQLQSTPERSVGIDDFKSKERIAAPNNMLSSWDKLSTRVCRSSNKQESEAVPDTVMRSSPNNSIPSASKQPGQLQSTPERSLSIDNFKSKERIAAPNNMLSSRDKLTTRVRRSSNKKESEAVTDAVMRCSPSSSIPSASKQPDQLQSTPERSLGIDNFKSKERIAAPNNMLSSRDKLTANGHFGIIEPKTKGDEEKADFPPGNAANPGVNSGKLETDNTASEMPGSLLDMPLADLWTDPCIAFAIQTLTGVCDTPKVPESKSSQGPGILATPKVHSERQEYGNVSVERQGCAINLPVTDSVVMNEHAEKVENGHKTDEKLGSSLDMPLPDIWADPCIEFAIKTLTGAIPIECGLENQDYFQQQPSSSLTQSSNHLSLPDVGIDSFSQTDYICQQYEVREKSISNEHTIMNPIFNYSHRRSGERP